MNTDENRMKSEDRNPKTDRLRRRVSAARGNPKSENRRAATTPSPLSHGGEGGGRGGAFLSCPSPRSSPHSFVAGRGGKWKRDRDHQRSTIDNPLTCY